MKRLLFSKKIFNYYSLLFIIFIIGLSLRTVKFRLLSVLEADEGRDLLVARHIVKFGEFVLLGHNSAGISGFYHGPYYYYLLAFLTFLYDNSYFIFTVMTIWHSLGIVLIFYTGKNLVNTRSGIIACLFYSLSLFLITTNNIWGFFISFQLFILSFFFFSLYYRKKSKIYFYLHVFLLVLSFATEYSTILIVPVFVFWTYIINRKKNNINNKFLLLKTVFFYLVCLIISFIPQIIYFGIKTKYFFVETNLSNLVFRFHMVITDFFLNVFSNKAPYIVFYILFILFPWLILKINRNKNNIPFNELIIIFVPIFGLIGASVKSDVYSHHLLYLYVFLFLGLGIIIDRISERKNFLAVLLVFPILLSIIPNKYFFISNINNSLLQVDKATENIKKR